MKLVFLAVLALLPLIVELQVIPGFNTFLWNQLDSTAVRINTAEITPMPLVPSTPTKPSRQTIRFGAVFTRDTKGDMIADMAIKACIPRSFCTPVPCIPINGQFFGTCNGIDFCGFVEEAFSESFDPENCSPDLIEIGIDCECPFKFKGNVNIYIEELVDMPSTELSPLLTSLVLNKTLGIDFTARDDIGRLGRLNVTFGILAP